MARHAPWQAQEVAALLERVMAGLAPGLRLVIDESSGATSSASTGLVWHAELDGRPLPCGRVRAHPLLDIAQLEVLHALARQYLQLFLPLDIMCRGLRRPRASMHVA